MNEFQMRLLWYHEGGCHKSGRNEGDYFINQVEM